MTLPVVFRDGQTDDLPFVINSWLKSSRQNCSDLRHIPESVFWPYQHAQVHALLQRCAVTVAADPEDPNHVLGYVVSERGFAIRDAPQPITRVHWVFVKKTFRRFGLGKMLLEKLIDSDTSIEHTFYTEAGANFMGRCSETMGLKFVFNPYARNENFNADQKRLLSSSRHTARPISQFSKR